MMPNIIQFAENFTWGYVRYGNWIQWGQLGLIGVLIVCIYLKARE